MVKIIICFKCESFFSPWEEISALEAYYLTIIWVQVTSYYQSLYDQLCVAEHAENFPVGILVSVPGCALGLLQN